MTEPPASLTYYITFPRDSVRIELILADFNDIIIQECDIGSTYINEKFIEKIWTKSGTNFGNNKGKVIIVIRNLHGLKSSGSSWIYILAETLLDPGYKLSREDMDICINTETNQKTGKYYYALVTVYVDDMLHIHHDPETFINVLKGVYRL